MDPKDTEAIKDQLRAMVAGRGDGIDLASPERWVVEDLKDPSAFFRALPQIMPLGSNLYLEGSDTPPELVTFYEQNRARDAVSVVRDTIFPVPDMFHVKITTPVLDHFPQLISKYSLAKSFHHIKGYTGENLLFSFHDAFDGSFLLISGDIPEASITSFCDLCAAKFYREKNVNNRDPAQLEGFLWALENPDKIRFPRPWWKKLLFFWRH
jgi:hypothetical protein